MQGIDLTIYIKIGMGIIFGIPLTLAVFYRLYEFIRDCIKTLKGEPV